MTFPITSFFKMEQPLHTDVFEEKLSFPYQFMYDNDPACEYDYIQELKENPKQDKNDLMASIIDKNISRYSRTRDVLLASSHYYAKWCKRNARLNQAILDSDKFKLYLITFTLGITENDSEANLKKFALAKLKKYKFMYTEERGEENGRYHIHAIVEDHLREGIYTTKQLKPTLHNTGYIQIKPYEYDNDNQGKYLSKETKVLGDVEYMRERIKKLK